MTEERERPFSPDGADPLSRASARESFEEQALDSPHGSSGPPSAGGFRGGRAPLPPPPSYADSVMLSRDAAWGGAGAAAGTLTVAVGAPEARVDGASPLARLGKTYVAYKVGWRRTDGDGADGAAGMRGDGGASSSAGARDEGEGSPAPPRRGPSQGAVFRRFRDFVGLADRLAFSHAGCFIPPRPDKQLSGLDASPEVAAERAAALDAWMRAVGAHAELCAAPSLRVFLEADVDQLGACPEWLALSPASLAAPPPPTGVSHGGGGAPATPANGSGSGGDETNPYLSGGSPSVYGTPSASAPPTPPTGLAASGLARSIRELGAAGAVALATASSATVGPDGSPLPCETDASFFAHKAQHAALAKALAGCGSAAERLVGRLSSLCDAQGDAGLAFVRLSKMEEAEAARRGRYAAEGAAQRLGAADLRAVGAACVRACRLGRAAAAQLAASLQPLHAHLAMEPAVAKAVGEREAAMGVWRAAALALSRARAKGERLRSEPLRAGGPFGLGATTQASKAQAVAAAEAAVSEAEAAEARARARYEGVAARNAREFARSDAAREAHLMAMGAHAGRVLAAAGARGAAIWGTLADGGRTPADAAA